VELPILLQKNGCYRCFMSFPDEGARFDPGTTKRDSTV
jgi:hypothetical protein